MQPAADYAGAHIQDGSATRKLWANAATGRNYWWQWILGMPAIIFIGLVANTEVAAISTPSLFVLGTEGYALFLDIFVCALGLALGLLILNYRYRWVRLPVMGR